MKIEAKRLGGKRPGEKRLGGETSCYHFCESPLCSQCSDLKKGAFEALTACINASWYCSHCVHAEPGVQKLLIRVGNVEERCGSLDKRVETLESKAFVSSDSVKQLVNELKEIESRKLNTICLNLP